MLSVNCWPYCPSLDVIFLGSTIGTDVQIHMPNILAYEIYIYYIYIYMCVCVNFTFDHGQWSIMISKPVVQIGNGIQNSIHVVLTLSYGYGIPFLPGQCKPIYTLLYFIKVNICFPLFYLSGLVNEFMWGTKSGIYVFPSFFRHVEIPGAASLNNMV